MAKYIDAKWHYPQKGEYPAIYGEYEHKHYPQIPCLVFYHGMYGVRFWNCTEECWDDEECDDFYCSKEEVEKWMYIDSLEQEQQEVDLEKFTEKMDAWKARYNYPDNISIKATMAFTARMFYMYSNVAREWYDSLPKVTQD